MEGKHIFKKNNLFEKFSIGTINTEKGRFYEIPFDGNYLKYRSITSVLGDDKEQKDALNNWRKRVGEKEAELISKRAAAAGTRMHVIIERYLNNEDQYLDDPIRGWASNQMFYNIKPILDSKIQEVYLQEFPLWSHQMRIAGRCDCLAKVDDKKTIVDFKSSRSVKRMEWLRLYFLQVAAYAFMFEEVYGEVIERGMIAIGNDEGAITPNSCFVFDPRRIKNYSFFTKLRQDAALKNQ